MSEYGIPYMGSKANIAASIALNFPAADNFYDLFGGGFSISHYMVQNKSHKYKQIHYNEIKSDIVDLVQRSISGEFNYDKFKPSWVSLEEFLAKKDTDAYMRICWSFGNNQKNYMFGSGIEAYKKSMHMAVVFNEFDDLAREVMGFNVWPEKVKTIKHKRFYLRQKIEYFRKTKIPKVLHQFLDSEQLQQLQRLQQLEQLERLEQLQQLQQLEQLQRLQQLEQLERLEQLQQLEQLHRLERLEQLQQLKFYSKDYREIPIQENSIVYCDIPYKGTADYGEFNHQEFFDWAASRTFPVYISEYNIADPRFKLIYSVDKRGLLSDVKSNKQMSEKLYWNGKL